MSDENATPPIAERLLKILPELSVVALALFIATMPDRVGPAARESVLLIALVEGAFCIAQGTLTDIATRLRRPPPTAFAYVLAGAFLIAAFVYGRPWFAEIGWGATWPIAWSIAERLRELWTMPHASRLEKLRRRALVSGRLSLLMLFAAIAGAVAGVSYVVDDVTGGPQIISRHLEWWVAAFFALTALDALRVHADGFARRPRTLVPRFDPLGVDYLAPL